MDPIERIDIRGDSTFAILLEAQKRGHDIFYYTPQSLALFGDRLMARGSSLEVRGREDDHYGLSALQAAAAAMAVSRNVLGSIPDRTSAMKIRQGTDSVIDKRVTNCTRYS